MTGGVASGSLVAEFASERGAFRLEAALRRAAGLSSRPTGAIIAGLGVAGDRGAKV